MFFMGHSVEPTSVISDCHDCCMTSCTGSTFQADCSTSSQSRCSNVWRTEIPGRLLHSGLRRRHSSTFRLRQSTSLDCAALPTKHIWSLGLLCWDPTTFSGLCLVLVVLSLSVF